jgi:hypothetical protein
MAVNKIIKGAPGKVLHTCGQWLLSTPYITLDGSTIQPTFTPAACDDIRPLTSGAVHYAVEHAQEIRWDDDPKAVIVRQRAAKDDDAEIPFAIWDTPFWEQLLHWGHKRSYLLSHQILRVGTRKIHILDVLRAWILRVWRRSVYRSFRRYMSEKYGKQWHRKDNVEVVAGRDCLWRVAQATFWDWSAGSRLFFWHWPEHSRVWARDGHPIYIHGTLPLYRRCQPTESQKDI